MHSHTDADSSVPFQFGWAFPLLHYFFRENLGFLSVLLLLLTPPPPLEVAIPRILPAQLKEEGMRRSPFNLLNHQFVT